MLRSLFLGHPKLSLLVDSFALVVGVLCSRDKQTLTRPDFAVLVVYTCLALKQMVSPRPILGGLVKHDTSFTRSILTATLLSIGGCAELTGEFNGSEHANLNKRFTSNSAKDDQKAVDIVRDWSAPEQEAFRRLYREGERNAVLNFNELGVAAIEAGNFRTAELAFDESLRRIDAIYANDENARKAKSLFSAEKVKDFKGEPYERSMAFYYRGLLYARAGDYQNARASFLAADYQDTVAEQESYRGDFGLMPYLAAWASACDGDASKAEDLAKNAAAKDPALAALSTSARMLYLLESGAGPVKVGNGKYKELLTFSAAAGGAEVPLTLSGVSGEWVRAGDLNYQASTRGGRAVQAILDGKAQFKNTTQAVGEAAVDAGLFTASLGAMTDDADLAQAGGWAALAGSLFQLASTMSKPAADTRQWSSLPREIYILGEANPRSLGKATEVKYRREDGSEHAASLTSWGVQDRCEIAWGRTQAQRILKTSRSIEDSKQARDSAFRDNLIDSFAQETSAQQAAPSSPQQQSN